MIEHKPTELLGQSINKWDAFYEANYDLIYQSCLDWVKIPSKARKLTEKVFLHLLFSHPENIANENSGWSDSLMDVFPEVGEIIRSRCVVDSHHLLQTYYNPN